MTAQENTQRVLPQITRRAAMSVLGVLVGTGVYFYQSTDNPGNLSNQDAVRSEVDLTPTPERSRREWPQPVTHPTPSAPTQVDPGSVKSATEPFTPYPTLEQQRTFDALRNRLHDFSFRQTHTYEQFLAMSVPEWESLPKDMQRQIIAEVNNMAQRGGFGSEQFTAAPDAPEPMVVTTEPSPMPSPPTAEQQWEFGNLRLKLHDPGFTRTRTLEQLASLPELQTLPPALQQQLTREVMGMLRRGELVVRLPENSEDAVSK